MEDEDIKILEELLKEFKTYNDLDGIQDLRLYIKAIENLLSRLKTAERMNDVLAEQLGKNYTNCKFCKNFVGNSYMFACKEYSNKNQCIKEWARNKAKESE